EPCAELLAVQHLRARDLQSDLAVGGEGDETVVETVQRDHLLLDLLEAGRELRMIPGQDCNPAQVGHDADPALLVRRETESVRGDQKAASAGLLALHLEEDVTGGRAE